MQQHFKKDATGQADEMQNNISLLFSLFLKYF